MKQNIEGKGRKIKSERYKTTYTEKDNKNRETKRERIEVGRERGREWERANTGRERRAINRRTNKFS